MSAVDHASRLLRANPWGDPAHRDLWVWAPPGHGRAGDARLPAVLVLPDFGDTAEGLLARRLDAPGLHTRFDHLLAATDCPPFLAVLPDALSTVGGTQYVDSAGIGAYASWLATEVLPFIDGRFRTSGRWAVLGVGSGGFGALHLAMAFPGRFAAVGAIAPELGFGGARSALAAAIGPIAAAGGPRAFLDAWWAADEAPAAPLDALRLLCRAAAFGDGTPEDDGFPGRLPADPRTGALRPEVLAAWARFDLPARLGAPAARAALCALDALLLVGRAAAGPDAALRRFAAQAAAAGAPVTFASGAGVPPDPPAQLAAQVPALVAALERSSGGAAAAGPPG